MPIRLFGTDIDGTLTDDREYFSRTGEQMVRVMPDELACCCRMLAEAGIRTVVISGGGGPGIEAWARRSGADHVFLCVKDKKAFLDRFFAGEGYRWPELAYIGDWLNDLPVIRYAGFSGVPANGTMINKATADYVCRLRGGEGCVLEFVKVLLGEGGKK